MNAPLLFVGRGIGARGQSSAAVADVAATLCPSLAAAGFLLSRHL